MSALLEIGLFLQKWVPSRGVPGAKNVPVNNVMRVLVMLLQNKRGMSAFPESGRSDEAKFIEMRDRFRPRLCENPPNFVADGTALHFDCKGVSD